MHALDDTLSAILTRRISKVLPLPAPPDIEVLAVDTRAEPSEVNLLLGFLDPNERAHAQRFRRAEDRSRFVFRRAARRFVLAARAGVPANKLTLQVNAAGRPSLPYPMALDVSFSSTKSIAVIAVGQRYNVGVDVEYLRPISDVAAMVDLVMTPSEAAVIRDSPSWRSHVCFLRIWTRKEAWLKGIGVGLDFPLNKISVEGNEAPRLISGAGKDNLTSGWRIASFVPVADCVAALAWRRA